MSVSTKISFWLVLFITSKKVSMFLTRRMLVLLPIIICSMFSILIIMGFLFMVAVSFVLPYMYG